MPRSGKVQLGHGVLGGKSDGHPSEAESNDGSYHVTLQQWQQALIVCQALRSWAVIASRPVLQVINSTGLRVSNNSPTVMMSHHAQHRSSPDCGADGTRWLPPANASEAAVQLQAG
jgi:hypothetical protein